MRIFWFIIGGLALALGIIGIVLPVVPTVPFLLVAAFAFARSSRRLHFWILRHRIYGPPIRQWQRRGAISRRTKWIACLSMASGVIVATLIGLPLALVAAQALVLAAVSAYIVTRPE